MKRKDCLYLLYTGLLSCFCLQLSAQEGQPYSVQSLAGRYVWLTGTNPAGLLTLDTLVLNLAETGYGGRYGSNHPCNEPSTSQLFSVEARSWYRKGIVALTGYATYDNRAERGKAWNDILMPGPVLFRVGDTITGKRKTERYRLRAATAVSLGQWGIGVGLDYGYHFQHKTGSLNTLSMLDFRPGVTRQFGNHRIGAHFRLSSYQETVSLRLYDEEPVDQYILYPLSFYKKSVITGSEIYVLNSLLWGLSLEQESRVGNHQFYHQADFSREFRRLYLEKQSDKRGGDSDEYVFAWAGHWQYRSSTFRHRLSSRFRWSRIKGYDPFQSPSLIGDASNMIQLGRRHRSGVVEAGGSLEYRMALPRDEWNDRLAFTLAGGYGQERSYYKLYPMTSRQELNSWFAEGKAEGQALCRRGWLDWQVGVRLAGGYGTGYEETRDESSSELVTAIARNEWLTDNLFGYATTQQLAVLPTAGYYYPLRRTVVLYMRAELEGQFALKGYYKGEQRWHSGLKIGVKF